MGSWTGRRGPSPPAPGRASRPRPCSRAPDGPPSRGDQAFGSRAGLAPSFAGAADIPERRAALARRAREPGGARARMRGVAAAAAASLRNARAAGVDACALVEDRFGLVAGRQAAVAARVDRHIGAAATAADGARDAAARSAGRRKALAGRGAGARFEEATNATVRAVRVAGAGPRAPCVRGRRALARVATVAVPEDATGAAGKAPEGRARLTGVGACRKAPAALPARLPHADGGTDARPAGARYRQRGRRQARAVGGRAAACGVAAAVGRSGSAGRDVAAATSAGGTGQQDNPEKHGGRVSTTATQATLHHISISRKQGFVSHESHAPCQPISAPTGAESRNVRAPRGRAAPPCVPTATVRSEGTRRGPSFATTLSLGTTRTAVYTDRTCHTTSFRRPRRIPS